MEENFNLIQAKSFVEQLNLDLLDVKKSFFKIGFRLDEAQRLGYYKELGFENISDCAEALFGFKNRAFSDGSMSLPKRWQNYSQSQLIEMSSCFELKTVLTPEDTIKDIKYFKSLYSKSGQYYDTSIKTLSEYIRKLEIIVGKSPEDEERQVLQAVKVAVLPPEKLIEENQPEEKNNVEHFKIFQTSGKFEEKKIDKEENKELKTLSDLLNENEKKYICKNRLTIKKDLIKMFFNGLPYFNYEALFGDNKQSFKAFLGIIADCLLHYLEK